MSNLFTCIYAAVEEGHFIQNKLGKTAYLVSDLERNLYVFTHDELQKFRKKHKVLEIFHPGGRFDGHQRLLQSYP